MKLNFNFPIEDFNGRPQGTAAEALMGVLQFGSATDEKYLDKIKAWARQLRNGKTIELDAVDARELRQWVMRSPTAFNFTKIALKDYIQKRIEEAEKKIK